MYYQYSTVSTPVAQAKSLPTCDYIGIPTVGFLVPIQYCTALGILWSGGTGSGLRHSIDFPTYRTYPSQTNCICHIRHIVNRRNHKYAVERHVATDVRI